MYSSLWKYAYVYLVLCLMCCVAVQSQPRYAYATIHYEGTPHDDAYLLGIRVLIHSIKLSGTKHDIIVLVHNSVKDTTKQILLEAGAKLINVEPIENPFSKDDSRRAYYQSRFDQTLIKLHVWNQLEYDRIIYMDADNIVLHNLDELFLCGHFCAIFMNAVAFHTGLFVVKPDEEVYVDMLTQLQAGMKSYDGADQGFLVSYFHDMEYAPMFNSSAKKKSEDRMNRIPINYNMNHIYYYEKCRWDVMYRRAQWADFEIPASTVGFPIAQAFKPWFWMPYYLFQVHWLWWSYRQQLGDDWTKSFMVHFSFIVLLVAVVDLKFGSPKGETGFSRYMTWKMIGCGLLSIIASCLVIFEFIPPLMPPTLALPLFGIAQNLVLFGCFLRGVYIFFGYTVPSRFHLFVMAATSFFVQFLSFYVSTADFSNPVYKSWFGMIAIASWIGMQSFYFIWKLPSNPYYVSDFFIPSHKVQ